MAPCPHDTALISLQQGSQDTSYFRPKKSRRQSSFWGGGGGLVWPPQAPTPLPPCRVFGGAEFFFGAIVKKKYHQQIPVAILIPEWGFQAVFENL